MAKNIKKLPDEVSWLRKAIDLTNCLLNSTHADRQTCSTLSHVPDAARDNKERRTTHTACAKPDTPELEPSPGRDVSDAGGKVTGPVGGKATWWGNSLGMTSVAQKMNLFCGTSDGQSLETQSKQQYGFPFQDATASLFHHPTLCVVLVFPEGPHVP